MKRLIAIVFLITGLTYIVDAQSLENEGKLTTDTIQIIEGAAQGALLVSDSTGNASWQENLIPWQFNGTNIFYEAGRVAIGSQIANADLDVDSTAVIGDIALGTESSAQDTSNVSGDGFLTTPWIYTNVIEAEDERGIGSTLIAIGENGNLNNDDEIRMVTMGKVRMTVRPGGKIGIGTEVPGAKLEVAGDFIVNDTTLVVDDINGRLGVGTSTPGSTLEVVGNMNVDGHTFAVDNTTQRVGIGTNSPNADLQVDSVGVIGQIVAGDQSDAQDSTSLSDKGFLVTPWIYTNAIEAEGERGSQSTMVALGNLNNFSNDDEINLVTFGLPRLTVKPFGKVGIGTTTPQETLDVDGSFVVDSSSLFVNNANHRVGVGTLTPVGRMTIQDTIRNTLVLKTIDNATETGIAFQNQGDNYIFSIHRDDSSNMAFALGSATNPDNLIDYFFFKQDGKFGIGEDSPTHPLQMGSGAHVTAAGIWTDASDRSKKYNIENLNYGLEEVLMLQPKSYKYKVDDSASIGFIAQELELILPELVSGEEGSKGIAYGQITAILVNAIKELKQENSELTDQNLYLKKQVSDNQNEIASIRSLLSGILESAEE